MRSAVPSPVPDQVYSKLRELLPGIRQKKMKGMVCPAGGFAASLFADNLLSREEIVGFLDNDAGKHGMLLAGLPVRPVSAVEANLPDFVMVASLSFSKEIIAQLRPLSRQHHFKLLDISIPDPNLHKTLPFVNSCLPPIPAVVLENFKARLPVQISRGSRVFLHASPIATNLWMRGVFAGIDVVGIVDFDRQLGPECLGLKVYSPDQVERLEADALIAADPEFTEKAVRFSLKIINLCEGMTSESYRTEWAKSLETQIWANCLPEFPARKVQIWIQRQNFGDAICGLTAAREFARRHPDLSVEFQFLPEIVRAYGDDLVRSGSSGYVIPDQSGRFLSEKWNSVVGNYQGSYYLGLGMDFDMLPRPELPILQPARSLAPRSFIALYPGIEGVHSIPAIEQLEGIVRAASLPVFCIGDGLIRPVIRGIDYSFAGSTMEMLRLIQHAALVITPRSAPAHIAAAYSVPSIVWSSNDPFEWHIDYHGWNHRCIAPTCDGFFDRVSAAVESLLFEPQVQIESRASGSISGRTPMLCERLPISEQVGL